jgi:hypothetical protein
VTENQTVQLIAALPEAPYESGVVSWVERCARSWLEQARALAAHSGETQTDTAQPVTETADEQPISTQTGGLTNTADGPAEVDLHQYVDSDARELEAVLLQTTRTDGSRSLVAIFVVENPPRQHSHVRATVLTSVAAELLEHGDAPGLHV